MPHVIMQAGKQKLDGSVKKSVFEFLEKLGEDDALPGLHIEPITGTLDARVRTGRVNDFWRAVLFKLQGEADPEPHYLYVGTFPHDEAITYAKKVRLRVNPVNGIAELIQETEPTLHKTPEWTQSAPKAPEPVISYPMLETQGISEQDLLALGIEAAFAAAAVAVTNEEALLALAEEAPAQWQGVAVLDLAFGKKLDQVKMTIGLIPDPEDEESAVEGPAVEPPAPKTEDDELLAAMRRKGAQLQFRFIEDDEELRAAVEGDFAAWRVFLHPEQRAYATRKRNGAFRLSGGAGTGKTVVLLHRARHLVRSDPATRVVLTTFNRTLADSLSDQLAVLDPKVPTVSLGGSGVTVASVDALVRKVLTAPDAGLASTEGAMGAVERVLGPRTIEVVSQTAQGAWQAAIDRVTELPPHLRSVTFFEAEYATVVLPNLVRTEADYLTVRRPGRGVPLARAARKAVWEVIAAYRAAAAIAGTTDWDEKAMIAAMSLDDRVRRGLERPADSMLVDEAQDLTPSRLRFLRALVDQGPNDLFLAEDAHQRIYGQKVVLARYGINIRGRSRRLTLNYRTTAQNLSFAVDVLSGAEYSDLSDESASVEGYRSSRSGPQPQLRRYDSLAAEYAGAATTVQAWIDDGAAPHTIGVLTRTRHTAESVERELRDAGVPVRFVERDTSSSSNGSVQVMTMHRAKGMEFSKVVLFEMSAGAVPSAFALGNVPEGEIADAMLRERSLVYVAATRARDELVVVWSGERSQLLPADRVGA
ncbi:3'-5' exonuclease [Pseudactinotalea suaedae]|uniref:3'-5' exonuclease n=1 Tax=Pseudactinotalea suaedae TaxID=1524924 RepID=UPI0012E2D002|nr:3'-5' exonuclease [Pseudactinotalea suaedae]